MASKRTKKTAPPTEPVPAVVAVPPEHRPETHSFAYRDGASCMTCLCGAEQELRLVDGKAARMKFYGWQCACMKRMTAIVEDGDDAAGDALDRQAREHARTCPRREPRKYMGGLFQVGLHPRVRAIVAAVCAEAAARPPPKPDASPQWTDNVLLSR